MKTGLVLEGGAHSYNRSVEDVLELEKAGKIFVIRPETPLEIGRMCHDPELVEKAYRRGIADGQRHLEALRNYLQL